MDWKLGGLIAASMLLLSGCNLYPEYQAKKQVRDLLRDPQSAQFSDMDVVGNGLLVCGKVNAKNGMGGYVGKRTFVIWADDGVAVAGDEAESIRYETCCMLLKSAVEMRRDSDQIDGYGQSRKGVAKNHFNW